MCPDPVAKKYHDQLLRRFMNAMMPTAKFKPKGVEWKKMGFQGENPVTDIRAGGLLAFETLEHFATYYTSGAISMVAEVTALYLTNKERFYPFSTAAVVLCTELCDLIGVSKRNRGRRFRAYVVGRRPYSTCILQMSYRHIHARGRCCFCVAST